MNYSRLFARMLPSLSTLRVSFYFTCVSCGLALLAARSVRADIGELGLAAGKQLAHLEDLTSEAEVLLVNGARFHHASTYSAHTVAEVLDRFQVECEKSPGMLGQGARAIPESAMARLDARVPRYSRNAIVRDESDAGGMLACFVGAKPGNLDELKSRLAHFSRTLDLAEFGDLRYVYASRKGDQTRVITLWTDSELNLGRMFPASGDAAGADSPLAPRPPASRRTLTAAALGMPFGLRIYESAQSERELNSYYTRVMAERGYSVPEGASAAGTTAFVKPDGAQVFVSLSSSDGTTFVTLTDAAGRIGSATAQVESE